MDGAEKFFKRLRQDGFEPNIVTYGTLLKGYAKENDLEKMMEKYEGMVKNGIKPNQTIFTTIMDAYGKNKDFASAAYWFKEMDARGCPPDQKAKNILLSLAKTEEEQEEANQLVGGTTKYQTSRHFKYSSDDVDEDEDEDEASDTNYSDDEIDVKFTSDSRIHHNELYNKGS